MINNLNCRCGFQKTQEWHLLCVLCYESLPDELANKLHTLNKTESGSDKHLDCIDNVFDYLDLITLHEDAELVQFE